MGEEYDWMFSTGANNSEPTTDLDFAGPGGSSMADEYRTYAQLYPSSGGILDILANSAKTLGNQMISPRGLVSLLGLLLGRTQGRPDVRGILPDLAPSKVTRTIVPSKYGQRAEYKYAADGGLMQAYAYGGPVTGTPNRPLQMEDGGFVMTKRAVDGAGGHGGLAQYLPGARPIVGPGDGSGVDDKVHAKIGNTTPARVSAGEAYVPKAVVDEAGGAKALYNLMNQLQRRA